MRVSILEFQCRHRYRSGFKLDVEFSLPPGITALTGPSGSGKTTILEAIAGMLRPQFGRITLSERTLFDSQSGVWLVPERRRIGAVFQDYLLFPHLTVEGNLRYGLKRRRVDEKRLQQVADLLDLNDLRRQYPATLSGGQRQRTALGRALLSDPELLVMDEPLNAQDAQRQSRILDYLQRIVGELAANALLVSHDPRVADQLGARCLYLDGGRLRTG